jgi:protein subunit release factor B
MDPMLEALQAILKKEALAQEQRNRSGNRKQHHAQARDLSRKTPIRAIPAPATRPWQR